MRSLRIVCGLSVLLAAIAATASAAEPARPVPQSTLAKMGFGAIRALDDREGLAVRGKGSYAYVFGTGYGLISRQHFARGSSHTVSPGGTFSGGGARAFAR